MKNPQLVFSSAAISVLAAAGLAFAAAPAMAQDEVMEEIVVEAPGVVRHEIERSFTGTETELIELRRRVGYSDLDLSMSADAKELENRIKDMAEEACKQLDEMFPLVPSNPNCYNQAVKRAMEQADEAIAAASE